MVLSAILKLDAGAFTTPLGKAVEGVKGLIRIGGEMGAKLQQAFDTGGMLSDLQAQTGELPGTLMVLRQAFDDTGIGADSLGQTLAIMRKSLGGISETGEPTAKVFKQLGLDIGSLQGMGAEAQLKTIGSAISGLATPAEQTAAAMGIFGRSGSKMLTLLKDPAALTTASQSLGALPALMNRNAAAFDAVSDRIGRIKQKGAGLWAGIAEGLLPLADSVSGLMDGVDLTGIGQRIGAFLGTTVELFRQAPKTFGWGDALVLGLGQAVNYGVTGFVKLGGILLKALSYPVDYVQAAFAFMFQKIFEWIGKIPKLGKALGLDNAKAQDYLKIVDETRDQSALGKLAKTALDMPTLKLIDTDDEINRLKDIWEKAKEGYGKSLTAAQAAAAPAATIGTASLEATKSKGSGKGDSIPTDTLARIGAYVGAGGSMTNRLASISERTAKNTERMAQYLERQSGPRMAWGV